MRITVSPLMQLWTALLLLVLASPASASQRGNLPDFTELAQENARVVVNISTTGQMEARGQSRGHPFGREFDELPDFFQEFFGGPRGQPERDRQRERRSMGSGFIVSADGYILTNNHVIENADEIMVKLSDRRELEAQVVGTDPRTDMAVLKVDATDLPVASIGRSADLQVGEWVFAIGSPFGFDHTVTAGIVSAKERALPRENYVPFIQTDVAINPGNSGGPLFNMDGEVVGVNSQIYTRSGGFMGVSFSIPMDVAMDVFEQIRDSGQVERGWLGVVIQEVTRDLAETFGLERPYGALVADVVPDSPADKAGLEPGDVILEFEGREIGMSAELPPVVGRTAVGTDAALSIMRDGEQRGITVSIEKLPEDDQARAEQAPKPTPSMNRLKVEVTQLPDRLRREWKLDGGVLVRNVADGPARRHGIQRNDVIVELNREAVDSVERFEEIVADLPAGRAIPVRIYRQGRPSILSLRVPE